MKYTFSTDFDKTNKNIGVSDERHKQFFEAAKSASISAIFTDKNITDKSQAMEMFLNDVQPENMVEAFWAGVVFDNVFSQAEKIAEKWQRRFLSSGKKTPRRNDGAPNFS